MAEDTIMLVDATNENGGSTPLPQKVSFSVTIRRPINGTASDVTAALAVFRDVVAGDEFTAMVNTQNYLK